MWEKLSLMYLFFIRAGDGVYCGDYEGLGLTSCEHDYEGLGLTNNEDDYVTNNGGDYVTNNGDDYVTNNEDDYDETLYLAYNAFVY